MKQKTEVIKARVPEDLKKAVLELAEKSGESEAYIVREAIRRYLEDWEKQEATRHKK